MRTLHLNAFLHGAGHHSAAWRHPASSADRLGDITYFEELARTAMQVFRANHGSLLRTLGDPVYDEDPDTGELVPRHCRLAGFEPVVAGRFAARPLGLPVLSCLVLNLFSGNRL